MNIVRILPEAAFLVAIAGLLQLVVLAFRNPLRPNWLRRDWVAIAAALSMATAISMAVGLMISGGTAAGLNLLPALGLTLALAVGTAYAIWHGFGVGERLRQADAGQSPFYPGSGTGALARGWRRQFGGGAGA